MKNSRNKGKNGELEDFKQVGLDDEDLPF